MSSMAEVYGYAYGPTDDLLELRNMLIGENEEKTLSRLYFEKEHFDLDDLINNEEGGMFFLGDCRWSLESSLYYPTGDTDLHVNELAALFPTVRLTLVSTEQYTGFTEFLRIENGSVNAFYSEDFNVWFDEGRNAYVTLTEAPWFEDSDEIYFDYLA